jgi:hypothetical protein
MANASAVTVDSKVDLPGGGIPVTVSLEAKGVGFVAFRMDLVRGDTVIRKIVENGTEDDLGKEFPLGNANDLLGLVVVTRGSAGAAVAGPIELQNDFHFNDTIASSDPAVLDITQTASSRVFRIRSLFQ